MGLYPSFSGALHLIRPMTFPSSPLGAPHEHLDGSGAEIPMDSNSCTVALYPFSCALDRTRARINLQWFPGTLRTENTRVSSWAMLLGRAASQKRHRARSNRLQWWSLKLAAGLARRPVWLVAASTAQPASCPPSPEWWLLPRAGRRAAREEGFQLGWRRWMGG